MSTHQANVTSTEVLETFRASVIVFSNKVQSAIDELMDEIRRTRSWVQQEQRRHWEGEVRRRDRTLAQAEQELLSARMVGLLENLSVQQLAVRKARLALEEAGLKLRHVKRWTRDFDNASEPLAKSLDGFRGLLAHDLPKGIAFLTQAQVTLADYRDARPAATLPRPVAEPGERSADEPSTPPSP